MKIHITLELDSILKKPIDEWDGDDLSKIDTIKKQPGNIVKLEEKDSMLDPGENAKPLCHTVKEGETLKSICEKYSISYGELSTHLMNTGGSTSIHVGQEIEIPRHFRDLSKAS